MEDRRALGDLTDCRKYLAPRMCLNVAALIDLAICFTNLYDESLLTLSSGIRAASFGGAAGVALLLFTSGMPRIQTDIISVSSYSSWKRE